MARGNKKKWTLKACFARFGAEPGNIRWSWSARSRDGKTIVVTMWIDEIRCERGRLVYGSKPAKRTDRKGFNERQENLIRARNHCGGRFRVVFTRKKRRGGIAACRPVLSLVMGIKYLKSTGKFRAESVAAGFTQAWLDAVRRTFPGEAPPGRVTWPR
jgi:hypothetical protein